jgi:hypothetical protein
MLKMVYERVGPQPTREHITRKGLMLHQLSLLFEHCRKGRAFQCGCVRLQQLFYDSFFAFGEIRPPSLLDERGAIIFGSDGRIIHTRKLKTKTREKFYSQSNVQLYIKGDSTSQQAIEPCCFVSGEGSAKTAEKLFSSPASPKPLTTPPKFEQGGAFDTAEIVANINSPAYTWRPQPKQSGRSDQYGCDNICGQAPKRSMPARDWKHLMD